MWISRTSLVLALLASCNWVYGLDETTLGIDTDGDGFVDATDNCPVTWNPDQLDSNDIDEGGDACAQCPVLIGVDLDEDQYDDGCDRCLGPGLSLADIDHDGIDDGCDPCIDGTSVFAVDFNANGIGDGCEACFEPPQGDSDQDGLDDACDKCLSGPPHDEDGDRVDDGCDNCPIDANPSQAGPPGSSVGDDCDNNTTGLERAIFEPFLVRDNFRWSGVTGMWSQLVDRTRLSGGGSRQLTASFVGDFRLVLRAQLTADVSIVSLEITDGATDRSCTVSRDGMVSFYGTNMAFTIGTEPVKIVVSYAESSLGMPMRCTVSTEGRTIEIGADKLSNPIYRLVIRATEVELLALDLVTKKPKT